MAESNINKDHERIILLNEQNNGENFDDSNIPNLHGYMVCCTTGHFIIGYKGTDRYSVQLRFSYWEYTLKIRMKRDSTTWGEWKYVSFI